MIVSCPRCGTDFAVPAAALGDAGRVVKCGNCGHLWRQHPVVAGDFPTVRKCTTPVGGQAEFMPAGPNETESPASFRSPLADSAVSEPPGSEGDALAHYGVLPQPQAVAAFLQPGLLAAALSPPPSDAPVVAELLPKTVPVAEDLAAAGDDATARSQTAELAVNSEPESTAVIDILSTEQSAEPAEAETWPEDRIVPASEIVIAPPPELPVHKAAGLPPGPHLSPKARLHNIAPLAALAPLIAAIEEDDARRMARDAKSSPPVNGYVAEPQNVPIRDDSKSASAPNAGTAEPAPAPESEAMELETAQSDDTGQAEAEIDSISIPELQTQSAGPVVPEWPPVENTLDIAAKSGVANLTNELIGDVSDNLAHRLRAIDVDLPQIEIPAEIPVLEAKPAESEPFLAPAVSNEGQPRPAAALASAESPEAPVAERKLIAWIEVESIPFSTVEASSAKETLDDLRPGPIMANSPNRSRAWRWHAAGIAAALLLIAGPLAALHLANQNNGKLFSVAGLGPADEAPDAGLGLANIVTEIRAMGSVQVLVLRGEVVNTSTRPRAVPPLRGALLGQGNRELQFWTFAARTARLEGGQRAVFETVIPAPSDDATDVRVGFQRAGS